MVSGSCLPENPFSFQATMELNIGRVGSGERRGAPADYTTGNEQGPGLGLANDSEGLPTRDTNCVLLLL